MANPWPGASITQLPQNIDQVSAFQANDNQIDPQPPSRPALKRSRKDTLQNSISDRFKRRCTSSDQSGCADYPLSSPPLYNAGASNLLSNSAYSLSSKSATVPQPSSTQYGTSRKTSTIAQFLQQLSRPLKYMPTGSKSKETPVIIPLHLRGEGTLAIDLYQTSVDYPDDRLRHQLYNNLAHVGMASIPDVDLYLDVSPAAGPSNYYARPEFRNFHGRGRAPPIPQGYDVYGNPHIPTRNTNRDASADSQRWDGLRPGTPGLPNGFSYFPKHPTNENTLRSLTELVPKVPDISRDLDNKPGKTQWVTTGDSGRNPTQTQNRYSTSALSMQLSDLALPLSMPTAQASRTSTAPLQSCLKHPAHLSHLSSTTTFVSTASHRSAMNDDDSSQYDADDDADDSPIISHNNGIERSQPIDIPARYERGSSLRRVQSLEHLRALAVAGPTLEPLDTVSPENTPPRRAFEGPRSRVCSTIRFVEPADQEEGGL